jgi:hypothetical protein
MRALFRTADVIRPKVKPDPQAAAALEHRLAKLEYRPEIGFHRDRRQQRQTPR